ncbi:hypothetical protein JCM19046_3501 [Bacillus sp. JCM 19046]|nr:hypothetical protein JCM19045_4274 [Bacillus sp. JCM 19045]GAF18890.1 hypothetical protein JCM19046_3501 [Bacillus sp. JCM 19046]
MNADIFKQITGFFSALLVFLGFLGVSFEWFTVESIDAFGLVLAAAVPLAYNLYTIYKNHFGFTEKAKHDKRVLDRVNNKEGK